MPAAAEASVSRDGEALRFAGALTAAQVPALWASLRNSAAARTLDLQAVTALDSAGLALLSSLAGEHVEVRGQPPGLHELRAAYRLDPGLRFARS
ncbi:MAG: STAS domain-containing protein [Pseudoxanthomonas suwonensis]|nr:STAS domain-containing protein [Pseudoxanthomonas suwonensis]